MAEINNTFSYAVVILISFIEIYAIPIFIIIQASLIKN